MKRASTEQYDNHEIDNYLEGKQMNKAIVGIAAATAVGLGVWMGYEDTVLTCGEVLKDPSLAMKYAASAEMANIVVTNCQNSCPGRTLTFRHDGSVSYASRSWKNGQPVCE